MTSVGWELFYSSADGTRRGQVDTYEVAEIFGRVNAVSTWRLVIPSDSEAAGFFLNDWAGRLEVAYEHNIWRSGPVAGMTRTVDLDGDMLELTGVDDTAWIARRVAHPTPALYQPPYNTQAYDVHSGQVTTVLAELVNVNLGPGAETYRRIYGITVPTPTPAGGPVTVSARWQNLLTLMQDTARPSGVIFEIVNNAFQARLPTESGAVFSQGTETMAGFTTTAVAPKSNFVYVGGGGELTARKFRWKSDSVSIGQWGGRFEVMVDRRDTTDDTEMDKSAYERLAEDVIPTTVIFQPIESEGQQFGRDWRLGDLVTVKAGNLSVHDQISEVHLTLDDNGATVVPAVGAQIGDLTLFRSLAGIDSRVRQLERI